MEFPRFRDCVLKYSQSSKFVEFSNLVTRFPHYIDRWRDLCHSKSGDTIAHLAAMSGSIDILRFCSESWPQMLTVEDTDKKVPLHFAAQFEQVECARFLLSRGVPVDPLKRADWTPLMLACTKSNLKMIQLLLDNEAQPGLTNKDGWNSFHIACREGHEDIINCLMDRYPLVWNTKSNNKRTPLHTAALHSKDEVVRILLSRASYQTDERDACGTTPLMDAATANSVAVMKLLIEEHQASPYAVDVLGRNVLQHALLTQSKEAELYLMSVGNELK